MFLLPRQLYASILIGLSILALIIRLVQKGRLDIAYCWLWLGIGFGMVLAVARYDWLLRLSDLIGSRTPTTTVFLLGFVVVLLLCLQYSLVISAHRRQIRRLAQRIAMLQAEGQQRRVEPTPSRLRPSAMTDSPARPANSEGSEASPGTGPR